MIFSKERAFKTCALALELVTLLIVASLGAQAGLSDNQNAFDPAFLQMRPRLGYFVHVDGYLKIYEEYFKQSLQKTDKNLAIIDVNDWRNIRPTGELCVNFLQGFQVRNYKLNKPFEIILVDACLDWIFDESSESKFDYDRFNSVTKEECDSVKKDSRLREIYTSTNFKDCKLPKELTKRLHEYFSKLLKIYADNPRNGCHSLWLQAYNEFIEEVYIGDCDDEQNCAFFGGLDGADKDSYLDLIVESTKQSSKNCYNVMMKQMTGLMYSAYDEETPLYSRIKVIRTKAAKQAETNRWSRDMIRILQVITGKDTDKAIELGDVTKELSGLKNNDPEAEDRIIDRITVYAMQKVNLRDTIANDPEGRAAYGRAMTKLCRSYIDPNSFLAQTGGSTLYEDSQSSARKPFEFYHLIYSLVTLTNHESMYGIGKDKFEEDLLKNGWEALYLTTFACQLISTTWAQVDYETNQLAYKVYLRPNARVLIEDWPLDVLERKFVGQRSAPEPEDGGFDEQVEAPVEPAVQLGRQRTVKNSVDGNQRFGMNLRFKIPLKNRLENHANIRPNLAEQNKPQAPKAPAPVTSAQAQPEQSNRAQTQAPRPAPESTVPEASEPLLALDQSTLEQFRRLHGHYPKNKPGELYPDADRNLEGVFTDEITNALNRRRHKVDDSPVPLAFNFDQHFVTGRKKNVDEFRPKSESVNNWASVDALFL